MVTNKRQIGAGEVWSTDDTCSSLASTCQEYVANNPSAFTDSYWLFNYINVYQTGGASTTGSGAAPTATSSYKRRVEKYRP